MDSHKHAGLLAGGFTLAVAATGCRALGALHMCVNRPLVVARKNLTLTPRASARAPRPPKGTAITRTRRSRSRSLWSPSWRPGARARERRSPRGPAQAPASIGEKVGDPEASEALVNGGEGAAKPAAGGGAAEARRGRAPAPDDAARGRRVRGDPRVPVPVRPHRGVRARAQAPRHADVLGGVGLDLRRRALLARQGENARAHRPRAERRVEGVDADHVPAVPLLCRGRALQRDPRLHRRVRVDDGLRQLRCTAQDARRPRGPLNFTTRRFLQMLFRLNFLGFCVCVLLNNECVSPRCPTRARARARAPYTSPRGFVTRAPRASTCSTTSARCTRCSRSS